MSGTYTALRERALANFELILTFFRIEYKKINQVEYDFINPTRRDTNFGACRFNVKKGFGADFAKKSFTDSDFKSFGKGFNASDFASFTEYGVTNSGFDIIGLVQRLLNLNSYKDAASALSKILDKLKEDNTLIEVTKEQIAKREQELIDDKKKKLDYAHKLWKNSRPIKDSLGSTYFEMRGIYDVDEPNIKFHYNVWNVELKLNIPCIVFRVSKSPESDLQAVHRVYLSKDGTRKAYLKDAKLALGNITNGAIWFGKPDTKLYIAEGPEEALTIKYCFEKEFVCSTVYFKKFSSSYYSAIYRYNSVVSR